MIEMVGRDALDPGTSHRHRGMRFETGSPKHGDKHRRLILADTTAVCVVHLGVMEGVALTFAHGYSGITDVIGHPMVQDPDLALLVGHALKKLSDLFPDLRGRLKTAVILIHIVEPHGFILPTIGR